MIQLPFMSKLYDKNWEKTHTVDLSTDTAANGGDEAVSTYNVHPGFTVNTK